jgi:hypothetical protein
MSNTNISKNKKDKKDKKDKTKKENSKKIKETKEISKRISKKIDWKIEHITYNQAKSTSDHDPVNLVIVHAKYEYIFGANEYIAYNHTDMGSITLVSVRPGDGISSSSSDTSDINHGPAFLLTDANHPQRILIPKMGNSQGIKVSAGPHLFGSDIFGNLGGITLNGSRIYLDNKDGIIKKIFQDDEESDVYFMIISRRVK